ncbi:MAG: hypothetical protein Ta2B_07550 [Termitinemataceae bacterium]|nr:MAG: hypothetical protein Ta2B_07550 [Termitinemataceae bacterium]
MIKETEKKDFNDVRTPLAGGIAGKELSLLEHFERIVEYTDKKGFTQNFWDKAKPHLEFAAEKLHITLEQAALFAHFLNQCDNDEITMETIALSVCCSRIKLLRYMDDFDLLEKKKLVRCCRSVSGYSGKENGMPTYRIPQDAINAVRQGIEYVPVERTNLTTEDLLLEVSDLFQQRFHNEMSFSALVDEIRLLINNNMHLTFCEKIKWYTISPRSCVLLLRLCDLFINEDDDAVGFHQIDDIFETRRESQMVLRSLTDGNHELMELKLVEFVNNDGYNDTEFFRLSDKTKQDFFYDINLKQKFGKRNNSFILAANITEKNLFYNKKEEAQVQRLKSLLQDESFTSIQDRLKTRGMRGGFACIFYGAPGTGKTETVYQLARETGRDILPVDISDTKSKWFGDSEKNIKAIFDHYKYVIKSGGKMPILLFNEADAVIGKRTEIGTANQSIDKTLNAIQNILLQEIETLEGILIATTNFEDNMDKAFERRFLYKIKFEKPSNEIRSAIWKSAMPELSDADALTLSKRFDFSGGQIENIVRKQTVEDILNGCVTSLEQLIELCNEELFDSNKKTIGFAGV